MTTKSHTNDVAQAEQMRLETIENCALIAEAQPQLVFTSPNHVRQISGADVAKAIRALAAQPPSAPVDQERIAELQYEAGMYRSLYENAIARCARVADEMREKHGKVTGSDYECGVWDQGVRIAGKIRDLIVEPLPPQSSAETARHGPCPHCAAMPDFPHRPWCERRDQWRSDGSKMIDGAAGLDTDEPCPLRNAETAADIIATVLEPGVIGEVPGASKVVALDIIEHLERAGYVISLQSDTETRGRIVNASL